MTLLPLHLWARRGHIIQFFVWGLTALLKVKHVCGTTRSLRSQCFIGMYHTLSCPASLHWEVSASFSMKRVVGSSRSLLSYHAFTVLFVVCDRLVEERASPLTYVKSRCSRLTTGTIRRHWYLIQGDTGCLHVKIKRARGELLRHKVS